VPTGAIDPLTIADQGGSEMISQTWVPQLIGFLVYVPG